MFGMLCNEFNWLGARPNERKRISSHISKGFDRSLHRCFFSTFLRALRFLNWKSSYRQFLSFTVFHSVNTINAQKISSSLITSINQMEKKRSAKKRNLARGSTTLCNRLNGFYHRHKHSTRKKSGKNKQNVKFATIISELKLNRRSSTVNMEFMKFFSIPSSQFLNRERLGIELHDSVEQCLLTIVLSCRCLA